MSDSEIMTNLICFHFNTYHNFKHYYLCYVKGYLKNYFLKAVFYNLFVELKSRVAVQMAMFLELLSFGECTGISFIDSTFIPVCHHNRIKRNKVFKGCGEIGKSTMGWFYGFKLHLICNEKGELINIMLTRANVDDRDENVFNRLTDNVLGKIYADKGYISQTLFSRLFSNRTLLVTGLKSNMKNRLMSIYEKSYSGKGWSSRPSTMS